MPWNLTVRERLLNKIHLYILTAVLVAIGLGLFLYKSLWLGFPIKPKTTSQVWNVEAHITFLAENKPLKASLFIPSSTTRFAIVDEHFISGGYGLVATTENGNRKATWSIRKAADKQSLYYQAVVRSVRTRAPRVTSEIPAISNQPFSGPKLEAAKALIDETWARSADTPTMVLELIKRLKPAQPGDNAMVLLGAKTTPLRIVETAARVIEQAGIPARVVQGIHLDEEKNDFSKKANLSQWLEVYHNRRWLSFDPIAVRTPVPETWLPWCRGSQNLAQIEGGSKLNITLSVSPKVEEGLTGAVMSGKIARPLLLRFSLFSLPVNTQAVFRIMFLIPVGAFLLVIMRNVVGVKTFGTFMPVLIGLAFRDTGLLWGILFFSIVVTLGLWVRFYLERLKLLVVPRLSAVLIIVIILMAGISILTHSLGIHRGLSVALFPMVILTMTIERMSIVWEERGPNEALVSGLGSLFTAALAFLVMNIKLIEHLLFVFPELLLLILAATLLLGRYSGYRLLDIYRFRALAANSPVQQ
jgi:hypothetical protein